MRAELVETLHTMASAAGGQLERAREAQDEVGEMGGTEAEVQAMAATCRRAVDDLELFIEMSQRQVARLDGLVSHAWGPRARPALWLLSQLSAASPTLCFQARPALCPHLPRHRSC